MAGNTKKTTRKKNNSNNSKPKRLTPAEIERFKQLLLEKRREIIGSVNEIEDEALKKSRLAACGDLSSMPIHMADLGTDNYEQEFALGLRDSEIKLLRKIDQALERIEDGRYGICKGTGQPIPKKRLLAKPWARYCIQYAQMLETGAVTEQEQD